ncbi:MAG: enoyl-CoA hydratase/isomerase family protein [Pseudomonadota bacterium]
MALVEFKREDDLAIITIDNPPVNAFSHQLGEEMLKIVQDIAESDARALLTRASGANFCAGADVNIFVGLTQRTGAGLVATGLNMIDMLETLPIPTVVAVNGVCAAAGMEILLAHDIVIVGEGAQMGQIESKIGTTTLAGGAQRIAARAGVARAKQMVFEGSLYDAKTMERWGIINQVVPDEELESRSLEYAQQLAAGATAAHAVTKGIINAYGRSGVAAADDALRAGAPKLFESQDKKNSVSTFLEKGPMCLFDGSLTYEGK